jgi:hypothetical protein
MSGNQYFLYPVQPNPGFGGQGHSNRSNHPWGNGVAGRNGQPVQILGVITPAFDQPMFSQPFGLRPDQGAGVMPFPPGGIPGQGNPGQQALEQILGLIDRLIVAALRLIQGLYGGGQGGQPGLLGDGLQGQEGLDGGLDIGNTLNNPSNNGLDFQGPDNLDGQGRPRVSPFRPDRPSGVNDNAPVGRPGFPVAVAANQQARAYGDPHIDGADGEKFDFDDHGIYNLLQDRGLNINAEMAPAAGEKSVITNVGMNIGGSQVQMLPNGSMVINGRPVQLENGQTLQLPDGSTISKKGNDINIKTSEYDVKLTSRAKGQYFDVAVKSKEQGVLADGVAPSGILGETFDADDVRGGDTKHNHQFYRRRNIMAF